MRQLFASLFGAGWAARPARAAVDDLPVRIGGAQYVRVASTPTPGSSTAISSVSMTTKIQDEYRSHHSMGT